MHRTAARPRTTTGVVHLLLCLALLIGVVADAAPAAALPTPAITLERTPSRVFLGQSVTFSGTVTPAPAGARVVVQRYAAGTWKEAARASLPTSGRYAVKIRPVVGLATYRVVVPATATHARAVSVKREIRARAYAFPIQPGSAARYPRDHHDYPAADIFAACGTLTVSPTGGRVHEVNRVDRWDPAVNAGSTRGGLFVSIIGDDGVRYYLSHFATIEAAITPGVRVRAGQRLGTVGRTGSARPTPCHIHFGISPPCGTGDWKVRRGVVWPQRYLDAWKASTDKSAAAAVSQWAAANRSRCPGIR